MASVDCDVEAEIWCQHAAPITKFQTVCNSLTLGETVSFQGVNFGREVFKTESGHVFLVPDYLPNYWIPVGTLAYRRIQA